MKQNYHKSIFGNIFSNYGVTLGIQKILIHYQIQLQLFILVDFIYQTLLTLTQFNLTLFWNLLWIYLDLTEYDILTESYEQQLFEHDLMGSVKSWTNIFKMYLRCFTLGNL